jgi:hypothetical protein
MAEQSGVTGPHPVLVQDLAVLIGLLAVLEAELMADEVSEHQARRLRDRFVREGLLSEQATPRQLRQAINDLNHRLRYALGEYPEPPQSVGVPD